MTTDTQANNKRIAKNTLLLYVRMIITTLVSLYTARLLLQLLGVEDFGIYNVVGGIVTFMSFINGTMTSATQRFLAFDLGKNDLPQFRITYSMTINVFILLCMALLLILEIAGPWFVCHKLVIPTERLDAALYVFQFSLLSFILSTFKIPYQSAIIAYEKMGVYAYLTLVEVVSKLVICYFLYITAGDRLILFAACNTMVTLVTLAITVWYCRCQLTGCRYQFHWESSLFKRLGSYAGWNLFGSVSQVMCTQGQTILLNTFFGPIVNAAKGISDRIGSIIMSFATNFYMAVSPQIIKTYAAGDIDYTRMLVTSSSRYSFYLMSVISLPFIFNMEDILRIWLGDAQVSLIMVRFAQWELLRILVCVLENPITMAIRATGDIKKYQVCVAVQTLLFLPICYVALSFGLPAHYSMVILTFLMIIVQATRVALVRHVINITATAYIKEVILPIVCTIGLGTLLSYLATRWECTTIWMSLLNIIVVATIVLTTVLTVGLKSEERHYLCTFVRNKMTHKR